ncbi:uncharacterized protein LOC122275700 isoform X8 [Carya illinoinensis]|uniref:uncharacterized protein LOC122275700 isoform X8 n=1 Tax=Carya illinoinensis TaxID=32201 RepID=UPI001C726507|nr:uncharacterized protein LOC122275700 isoform X8 [Carya illinoinensis]XP_042940816.1 uncharacterized protein LOC122275700 isoform X8 [Carya illinoinensis]
MDKCAVGTKGRANLLCSDWDLENHRLTVLKQLRKRFNAFHHELHKKYLSYESHEEALASGSCMVDPVVWVKLCGRWGSDDFKKISRQNRENRKRLTINHTAGRKSFVRYWRRSVEQRLKLYDKMERDLDEKGAAFLKHGETSQSLSLSDIFTLKDGSVTPVLKAANPPVRANVLYLSTKYSLPISLELERWKYQISQKYKGIDAVMLKLFYPPLMPRCILL